MASKNSRTSRPAARSSRAPQSARAVRSAKAAQSGRIASNAQAASFSQQGRDTNNSAGYHPAYTAGAQGRGANSAYSRQTAASQYSRNNPTYATAGKKSNRGKKIAIGVLAAVLVVVVGGGTAFALWTNAINEKLNKGDKTDDEISAISDALAHTTSYTEPFYMMLIGSDQLDDDPEGGARSDTNIVVRVDPVANAATMVSIPRDTKIEIDGYGTNKFNAAYSYDGVAGAVREANQLLGVSISHYAEVNFDKLKELVDAVGGVDVTVDQLVDDPDADGTVAHPEWPHIVLEPGEQHLDGNQALVFARSRAYPDGDFTRTANQRKLIMAIVNKVLALPITELPGVVESAASAVTTDLSVNDILGLAQQFKDEGELTIYSALLPSYIEEITEGGVMVASYVINDEEKTKEMMKVVEAGGDPEGIVSTKTADSTDSTGVGTGTGTGTGTDSGYYDPGYYAGTDTGTGTGTGYDSGYYDPNYGTGTGTGTGTGDGTGVDAGTGATGDGTGGGYDNTYPPDNSSGGATGDGANNPDGTTAYSDENVYYGEVAA